MCTNGEHLLVMIMQIIAPLFLIVVMAVRGIDNLDVLIISFSTEGNGGMLTEVVLRKQF